MMQRFYVTGWCDDAAFLELGNLANRLFTEFDAHYEKVAHARQTASFRTGWNVDIPRVEPYQMATPAYDMCMSHTGQETSSEFVKWIASIFDGHAETVLHIASDAPARTSAASTSVGVLSLFKSLSYITVATVDL